VLLDLVVSYFFSTYRLLAFVRIRAFFRFFGVAFFSCFCVSSFPIRFTVWLPGHRTGRDLTPLGCFEALLHSRLLAWDFGFGFLHALMRFRSPSCALSRVLSSCAPPIHPPAYWRLGYFRISRLLIAISPFRFPRSGPQVVS